MIIAYTSKTGNVRRFIKKLNMKAVQITKDMVLSEPYILITYTTGYGQVPDLTTDFLKNNAFFLQGVSASGNKNWGDLFGKSADIISNLYGVPVISKFELAGSQKDVYNFMEGMKAIETY